jgi:hypothetical protein
VRLVAALAEKAKNLVISINGNLEPRSGGPEAGVLKPPAGWEIGSQEIIFFAISVILVTGWAPSQGFSAPVAK